MGEPDRQAIRRKIMGALLRHARLTAGRSQAELAASLHVSRYRYAQYEQGQRDLSLPELEVVAQLCGVPLGYFFDDEAAVEDESMDILHLDKPRIQRKIVGALLRQARQKAGKSQKECADLLSISTRRISQYEYGKRDILPSELEVLAPYLDIQMSQFTV
jgi:transcriptional regulator with XRE-family HTH domain